MRTNRSTVLLVDDSRELRDGLQKLFEIAGYEVAQAADGEEALHHCVHGPEPSVIVLDLKMPGMNGEQLLAMLRSDSRLAEIPVIVMSADDIDDAMPGIYSYLRKPADPNKLLRVVAKLAKPVQFNLT